MMPEYDDDECPYCGGEGVIEGECTCGDDCCCCADPEPPACQHCMEAEPAIDHDYLITQGWLFRDTDKERLYTYPKGFDVRDIIFSDAVKIQQIIDRWSKP